MIRYISHVLNWNYNSIKERHLYTRFQVSYFSERSNIFDRDYLI